ncbi:unnamed protein product, partial [Medioppia subpectinata]
MVLTVLLKTLCRLSAFSIILAVVIDSQRLSTNTSNPSSTNVLDFSQSLIANIQSNGLRGYVLFVENNGITSIRANILGANDKRYDWKVYGSTAGMSGDNSCPQMSPSALSLDLTAVLGPIEIGRENVFTAKFKSISGENTLIGRTL